MGLNKPWEEQKGMFSTTLRTSSISAVVYVAWSTTVHCKKRFAVCGFDNPAGDGKIDKLFLQCSDFATLSYPLVRVEAVLTTRSLAGAAAAVIERGRPRLPVLAARAAGRPAVRGSVVTPPLLYQLPQYFFSHKYLFVPPLRIVPIRMFRMLFWKQQHFYNVRCCDIRQGDSVVYAKCVLIDKLAVYLSIFETTDLCCGGKSFKILFAGFWTEAAARLEGSSQTKVYICTNLIYS
jgi:hypothetical protein